MADAKEIVRRHDRLKADRAMRETLWQEIAEVFRPLRADFTVKRNDGERRGRQRFDGTPSIAGDNLASGLWGMVTNSANEWFTLSHEDPAIARSEAVSQWLEIVTRRMRAEFAGNGQRFYARALEVYQELVFFGTGLLYVDEAPDMGRLRFSARKISECVLGQNDEEVIDTVYRKWEWTARQAVARWGDKAPTKCREAMAKDPDERFWFIHAVEPNEGRNPRYEDSRGMRFRSCTVCLETMEVVQEGGYREFPYMVPRWSTDTGSVYGDGPAMLAQTDANILQAMTKTHLVASQKAADPPLLAKDENSMPRVRVTPGGITYGAVSPDGRPLVVPLETRGVFTLTEEMLAQRRQAVRDAFHASLLLMSNMPGRTATEVLAMQEEKLRLMGPNLGRVQSEFLDPLIERAFAIMYRAGAFPPPPEELAEAPELRVEYVSPLARAQRASEGGAIMRTVEAMGPLAQVKPEVMDNFDFDAIARGLAEAFGMPASMLRAPEKVMEQRQARVEGAQADAQNDQMAGMAQMLPGLAKAAKDMGVMPAGGAA
jgi:hypothetical protein